MTEPRTSLLALLVFLGATFGVTPLAAQADSSPSIDRTPTAEPTSQPFRRHSLGSSLFMLSNVVPSDEPPYFVQLNYQYRLTPRDVVSLEAITWHYYAPLGIPYGSSWGAESENYPGFVRAAGLALVYKRFLYRGAYTALHAANMHQAYVDEDGSVIQRGYQLFLTWRVGYHFEFARKRLFVEPSIAITAWPINTNLPASFRRQEEEWGKVFVGEPGLHFGVNF